MGLLVLFRTVHVGASPVLRADVANSECFTLEEVPGAQAHDGSEARTRHRTLALARRNKGSDSAH